jgi:hypothetical protein
VLAGQFGDFGQMHCWGLLERELPEEEWGSRHWLRLMQRLEQLLLGWVEDKDLGQELEVVWAGSLGCDWHFRWRMEPMLLVESWHCQD